MGQNEQKSPEILNSPDLIRVRFRLVAFVLILVGIGLAVRFFYIQVFKREYYLTAARNIYTKNESLSGLRGEIRDRNNNLFAGNSPRLDVACSPFDLKNNDERLRLARIMNKHFPEKSIKQYYDSFCKKKKKVDEKGNIIIGKDGKPALRDNKYTLIKRHVPLEKVKELKKDLVLSRKEKKKQNLIWLVSYTPSYVRIYPKGYLLSNLIGYSDLVTGTEVDGKVVANEKLKKKKSAAEAAAVKNTAPEKKDPKAGDSKKEGDKKRKREVLIGRSGLEFEFDDTMAPGLVTNKFEKTPSGHPIIFADNKISVPDNGKDIFLTILEPIQAILEEELETAVKEWNPDGIMAAIADPRTGEILAIAQRPAFNPGDRSTFHIPALRMRFAQDVYEPGSLAKPFSVLMALEKNLVKPEDFIDCENGRWAEKKLSDSHRYDKLTVSQVIQKSSNIGTAKIAVMMGKNGVYQALRRFGFNSRSGLPLGNEVKGLLPRPAAWDSLAITRIPIGYSFNTTLLQLLRAYCGLANNGKVPYLKLIHGIRNPQTGVLKLTPPARFTDSGADPVHLYKLIDMMISVTEKGGTARQAAIPGFQVAGKTGTSRKNIEAVRDPVTKKIIRKSHYSLTEYYASFAGFVPAHEPRLVMVVTVDRPRGTMYGGTAAAPVFRRTMERTLRYLNIQPTEPVLNVSGRKRH